jgi:4-amino-4-deoxy-L-arabinose transferase-like glycosyltransferase
MGADEVVGGAIAIVRRAGRGCEVHEAGEGDVQDHESDGAVRLRHCFSNGIRVGVLTGRRIGLGFLLLLFLAASAIRLDYSPIYMHDAEVQFALHARSIAATLHDAEGRLLPLYFHMPAVGENVWFHPMLVYFTAIFLKFLPFSEWSVRFPSVVVASTDIALMYLIGCRLYSDRRYGLLAAGFLALTPAHFIHSRLAMDYIYPVPFVLLWLWCVEKFDDREDVWAICAGFVLGVGFYSYIAAVVFMPLYLVLTWIYLFARHRRLCLSHVTSTAAFCIPLVFVIVWRIWYPEVFSGTAYRYAITRSGLVIGMLRMLNYNVIQEYVSLYWNFHNPAFLFFVGSPNFQSSTRAAGVYTLPMIVFLVAGLYDAVARERTPFAWLLVAGFVTAPIPAVLVEEPMAIYREMVVLPFAILIAAYGARLMIESATKSWRIVAIAALVIVLVHFGYFIKDYFTDYRLNLYAWFGGNIKGAVTSVLDLDAKRAVPAIYVSPRIPYGLERWHFYLDVLGREDLFARTRRLTPADTIAAMPSRSIIVLPAVDHDVTTAELRSPDVRKIGEIVEPFGARPTAFVLFERN